MNVSADEFESSIRELTLPLNGQFPRPWMTKLSDPLSAEVFIIGKNQRNGYSESALSHSDHLNGLFNRNGFSCRSVYEQMTDGKSSPTRRHTDQLVTLLENERVTKIIETNVICYSSPMSADLRLAHHVGGARKGEEIFRYLLAAIKPKVLIVHGAGSKEKLSSILSQDLGDEPSGADDMKIVSTGDFHVIVIPSLAPPAWNKWCGWADNHLGRVAKKLAGLV